MKDAREQAEDPFLIHIGRAGKGLTFVRVVHVPSGKERALVGLGGESPLAVAKRLTDEIRKELGL
jgi:hypothetical protein